MLSIDNILVSDEVFEKHFICNLQKCKGACCVEGELGAPLEAEELPVITSLLPAIAPYLTETGKAEIERQGAYVLDEDGDYSTPTIGGKECAYAFYDDKKTLKCGIEKAYLEGKVDFQKPISCHLYPIRILHTKTLEAVNYHEWDICRDACMLGEQLKTPVYQFLKTPLIRKYGSIWYDKLANAIEQKP